jgi:uncharacterized membrane protein YdjX (TVP38/TMEM64 family)
LQQDIIELFTAHPEYAVLFSILINVVIAILGVVPSVFVTAANVLFFGFWQGTAISFAGESIGAFVSFILFRKGFKKKVGTTLQKYPAAKKLLHAEGKEAFLAIVSLRLLPFVPSGIVTFAAAVGSVSLTLFVVASSLGKIPALLIEAYAAYQVTEFGWQGKLILFVTGIYLLYLVYKKLK